MKKQCLGIAIFLLGASHLNAATARSVIPQYSKNPQIDSVRVTQEVAGSVQERNPSYNPLNSESTAPEFITKIVYRQAIQVIASYKLAHSYYERSADDELRLVTRGEVRANFGVNVLGPDVQKWSEADKNSRRKLGRYLSKNRKEVIKLFTAAIVTEYPHVYVKDEAKSVDCEYDSEFNKVDPSCSPRTVYLKSENTEEQLRLSIQSKF